MNWHDILTHICFISIYQLCYYILDLPQVEVNRSNTGPPSQPSQLRVSPTRSFSSHWAVLTSSIPHVLLICAFCQLSALTYNATDHCSTDRLIHWLARIQSLTHSFSRYCLTDTLYAWMIHWYTDTPMVPTSFQHQVWTEQAPCFPPSPHYQHFNPPFFCLLSYRHLHLMIQTCSSILFYSIFLSPPRIIPTPKGPHHHLGIKGQGLTVILCSPLGQVVAVP